MTTFVLTHGAWGGSYGFHKVRRLLAAAGHEVFTPSLTGIGERAHLSSEAVCLSTHVTDLVNTIEYEDLSDIVLLGFSYGGMVVSGALDQIGDRVSHLIFLDALVPQDGQSAYELIGVEPPTDPSKWLIEALPRPMSDPDEQLWSDARRTGQPVRTFSEPAQLSTPTEHWPFTLTFIKASADPNEQPGSAFWQAAAHAESSDRWRYQEIATDHLVPFSEPEALVAILLDIARA